MSNATNSLNPQKMTPDHPRWIEFCVRMQRLNPNGGCQHTTDFAFEVLNLMGGIDIPGSLEYFAKHGGHCDCEIIFNVILPALDAMDN